MATSDHWSCSKSDLCRLTGFVGNIFTVNRTFFSYEILGVSRSFFVKCPLNFEAIRNLQTYCPTVSLVLNQVPWQTGAPSCKWTSPAHLWVLYSSWLMKHHFLISNAINCTRWNVYIMLLHLNAPCGQAISPLGKRRNMKAVPLVVLYWVITMHSSTRCREYLPGLRSHDATESQCIVSTESQYQVFFPILSWVRFSYD